MKLNETSLVTLCSLPVLLLSTSLPAVASAQDTASEKTVPAPTIDTNGDGTADGWDSDGNGKADILDTDGDGQPDAYDRDEDGQPD